MALGRAVAILDRNATPALAAALAGLEPREAADAVDALIALEIFAPGERLGFVHPIVRTAVYNDFGSAERGALHARAARLLSEAGADPDSIGAQLTAAPPSGDAWAVAQLREAGEAALSRGAPEAAVSYLDRALAEPPPAAIRSEVLFGLGRADSMLGDGRAAIRRLREALELATETRTRVEIVHVLFRELSVSRAGDRVIDLLERELAALGDDERELGPLLESDIHSAGFLSLPAKRAAEHHRRRFDDPQDPGLQSNAAMNAALYGGTADRAAQLALARSAPGSCWRRRAPIRRACGPRASRCSTPTGSRRRRPSPTRGSARRAGRARCARYSLASSLRARASLWLGELAEAEGHARTVIDGMPQAVGLGRGFLAEALLDQGRGEEAEIVLRPAERAEAEIEWSFFLPTLLISRAAVSVSRGALDRGCESALAAGRVAAEWGLDTPGPFQWRPLAAEALAARGERERAVELIEAELESCRRYGSPRALGIALRVAGRIDLDGRALALLADAAAALSETPARLEQARALVDLGAALRRARQTSEAREHLREGLGRARACGARTLAERAHEELVATGARPRKIVRAGVDALTSSERRVARMAAEGMTNKEIAQHLFVTVRTVEAHLHHTYQKLEISSRNELARALERA